MNEENYIIPSKNCPSERPPGRHGSKSLHAAKSIFEKRKLKYVKRHLVGCATDGGSRPRSHDVSHRLIV